MYNRISSIYFLYVKMPNVIITNFTVMNNDKIMSHNWKQMKNKKDISIHNFILPVFCHYQDTLHQ